MKTTALFAFAFSSAACALTFASVLGACSDDPVGATDASTPSDATADAATADTSTSDATVALDAATPPDATADGGLSAVEKRMCDALTSRAQCFDGSNGPETCDDEKKCFARIMVPAAVESYADCRKFPACMGDDRCLEAAGTAVGGQPAQDYTTACLAKVTACGAEFPDDELCSPAAFAYQGIGAAAAACLTKPCADQKTCFDAALAPIVACKQL